MLDRTYNTFVPWSVTTVRVLTTVPCLPAIFMVAPISPPAPGAIVQGVGGTFAMVQPQEVCTLVMMTLVAAMLVTQKLKVACASPALAVYSLLSASNFKKASTGDGDGCAARCRVKDREAKTSEAK